MGDYQILLYARPCTFLLFEHYKSSGWFVHHVSINIKGRMGDQKSKDDKLTLRTLTLKINLFISFDFDHGNIFKNKIQLHLTC